MSTKRNYIFSLVQTLTNLFFPIITFPYVSRILKPEGIGSVQFAVSFAQAVAVVGLLGIPIYGVKEIANARLQSGNLNRVFSELFWIQCIGVAVTSLAFAFVIYTIPMLQEDLYILKVTLFIIVFSVLNLEWFYNGLQDFSFTSVRSVVVKLISIALILLLVSDEGDISVYGAIMTFGFAGNYFLNLLRLSKKVRLITNFKELSLRQHLPHLFYILSTLLVTTLYTYIDSVLLGFLTNKYEVGIYAVAIRVSKIGIPIVITLITVLIPRTSVASKTEDRKEELRLIEKSFSFILFVALPATTAIFLLSEELVLIFAGAAFAEAIPALALLAPLPIIIGLAHLFAFQILIPRNLGRIMLSTSGVGLLLFLVAMYNLVPSMGAAGAAASTLATEFVVTTIYLFRLPREVRRHLPWKRAFEAIVAASIFLPTTYGVRLLFDGMVVTLLNSVLLSGLFYLVIQYFVFNNEFVKMGLGTISDWRKRYF